MMFYLRSIGAHRILFALLVLANFAHAQNSNAPSVPGKAEAKKARVAILCAQVRSPGAS